MGEELTKVDYTDLVGAVCRAENCAAYVNRGTGEVIVASGYDSMLGSTLSGDELIGLPSESELGLGSALVWRFAEKNLPSDVALIRGFFQRRNAHRLFQGLLRSRRLEDAWAEFQDEAREQALRAWCTQHQLALAI